MGSYIVEDVCLTDDYFFRKHKYFLSSESRGKYFKLNKTQYEFFDALVPFLKSTDDREKIEEFVKVNSNGTVEMSQVDSLLRRYNILYDSHVERKGTVEAEFTSNKLCELPLTGIQRKCKKILNAFWWILLVISIVSISGMLVMWGLNAFHITVSDIENIDPFLENGSTYNWWLLLFGTLMCIVVHELGHLLSANHFGIEYKSITVALKWGISPIYYVRYKNFYHHKSVHKLITILSGIWMNFFMISVYCIIDSFIPMRELEYLIMMNLLGILNNILPKGTSDGYHDFCTLIGIEGIRWKMLGRVSVMLNNRERRIDIMKDRETRLLLIYFLVSYGISIFGCFKILNAALSYFSFVDNEIMKVVLQILAGVIIVTGLLLNILKLVKNVKRINENV